MKAANLSSLSCVKLLPHCCTLSMDLFCVTKEFEVPLQTSRWPFFSGKRLQSCHNCSHFPLTECLVGLSLRNSVLESGILFPCLCVCLFETLWTPADTYNCMSMDIIFTTPFFFGGLVKPGSGGSGNCGLVLELL